MPLDQELLCNGFQLPSLLSAAFLSENLYRSRVIPSILNPMHLNVHETLFDIVKVRVLWTFPRGSVRICVRMHATLLTSAEPSSGHSFHAFSLAQEPLWMESGLVNEPYRNKSPKCVSPLRSSMSFLRATTIRPVATGLPTR